MTDRLKEESQNIISDKVIQEGLDKYGWDVDVDSGRLMLMELMTKVSSGYYVSQTEGLFLEHACLLDKEYIPTQIGMRFLYSLLCSDNKEKPLAYHLFDKCKK